MVFRKKRSRRSRFNPFRKRSKSRRSRGDGLTNNVLLGAALYGAVREKASNALAPLTAKVPLGNIADEVVLGGIGYIAAKKIRNPMIRNVCKAAVIIEAARIGEAIIKGQVSLGVAQTNNAYNF